MKKTILIAAIISGGIAYGQKGSWYIGGATGFYSTSNKSSSPIQYQSNGWSVSPEIGTFLTNHIQLGIGINTGGDNTKYFDGLYKYRALGFGGTVYSRYLFGDAPFKPFLGISTGYQYVKSERNGFGNNIHRYNATLNAGFAYYVTPKIGLFGSVGIIAFNSQRKIDDSGSADQVTNSFGTNISTLGNRFTIGMYYTFREGSK